jgi:aminomethyltransferase
VQYQGIIPEHKAVREKVGIFDVSHMGRVIIKGKNAESFMDFLSTNKIAGKKDFSATYTVWCLPSGGTVDDLIVYKQNKEHFFVIVNASNRKKDFDHLMKYSSVYDVQIEDCYADGIIAIQGPKAKFLVSKIFTQINELKPMHFVSVKYKGKEIILSETGYTGAGGIEIYAPMAETIVLWQQLLNLGKEEGIQPVGLGARDTLRLEMGYALYGHELSEAIAPNESVSVWTIKWDNHDFLGKDALAKLEKEAQKRYQYGIVLTDRGIAREGYEVFSGDIRIGIVTSGTMSPSLNQAIAMIMVERKLQYGENIQIQIRNNKCNAKVVKLPFYKNS